jgi:hypothetical protein
MVSNPILERIQREAGVPELIDVLQVLLPLTVNYPGVLCELDSDRETGRGYYVGACFHVYATNVAGTESEDRRRLHHMDPASAQQHEGKAAR